jgi:hypothetical protein
MNRNSHPVDAASGEPAANSVSRLSVNLRRSGDGANRLSASPSTNNTNSQVKLVRSPVSPNRRPLSSANAKVESRSHSYRSASHSGPSQVDNVNTCHADDACITGASTCNSTTANNNWVNVRTHTAKCNIMLRKKRRGNKRSKSLPSKFK